MSEPNLPQNKTKKIKLDFKDSKYATEKKKIYSKSLVKKRIRKYSCERFKNE